MSRTCGSFDMCGTVPSRLVRLARWCRAFWKRGRPRSRRILGPLGRSKWTPGDWPGNWMGPAGEGRTVAALLGPAPFETSSPDPVSALPLRVGIVRGGSPQPASALGCRIVDLTEWADSATSAEIEAVRAARSGERAFLLGA